VPYQRLTRTCRRRPLRRAGIRRKAPATRLQTAPGTSGIMGSAAASRITPPRPRRLEHRLVDLLRQQVTRYDHRTKIAPSVAPGMESRSTRRRRRQVPLPLVGAAGDRSVRLTTTLYYGCNVIFHTTARDRAGRVSQPDLSVADASKIISPAALSRTTSASSRRR